jgi:Zn-dependent protease
LTIQPPAIESCPQCGTQLAPTMLSCPGCARLVHADVLATLAQAARNASDRGEIPAALASWREALDLLPVGSRQHQVISVKITELGQNIPPNAVPADPSAAKKGPALGVATSVGAIGLMLWKLKALLLGLTKGTTLLSMLLSLGVYWTAWGWQFALGLVLSIYVHEMGHVIALRRYGFKATAPMFIPGLGALIRLKQQVVNPREDAEIGLAGPIYGLGAAAFALGLWFVTERPIFAGIAGIGALFNLFNLLPISPLDGGRGFHAMSRAQKFFAAATVAGGAWLTTSDRPLGGLLLIVAVVGFARAVGDKSTKDGSWKAAITYGLLIVLLTAISTVRSQTGVGN